MNTDKAGEIGPSSTGGPGTQRQVTFPIPKISPRLCPLRPSVARLFSTAWLRLRVCLKNPRGAVFVLKAGWRGVRGRLPCASAHDSASGNKFAGLGKPNPSWVFDRGATKSDRFPGENPAGGEEFCPWASLVRPLQPPAGMFQSRHLAHRQFFLRSSARNFFQTLKAPRPFILN